MAGVISDIGSTLLSSLNSVAGVAENAPASFDLAAIQAAGIPIDAGAVRSYVETGFTGVQPNIRPNNQEITFQTPNVTVLVKKRAFSSLSENYRYELMNADEKLFLSATRRLFQNKCRAIAAFEQLTKISEVIQQTGIVSDFFFPAVLGAVDAINAVSPGLISGQDQAVFDTIQRVKSFSDPVPYTTWLIDSTQPFVTDTGLGTGVIEFTTLSSFSSTTSVEFGGGNASLNFDDPYKLMVITNNDIDVAIRDSTRFFGQNSFFQFTTDTLQQTIASSKQELNDLRKSKGKSPIIFLINENSLLFKKVRAIIDLEGREIIFNYDGGLAGIGGSVSLDDSATTGFNGLSSDEVSIFQKLVQSIYQLIGLQFTNQQQTISLNAQTNYVRRKLRLHYGGKNLIQPMDSVHIFVSSKTVLDDKIAQGLNTLGLNSGGSFLDTINTTIGNLASGISNMTAAFGGQSSSGDTFLQTEKNMIAGPNFPTWLWLMMRNSFTSQPAGTQVFSGLVSGEPRHSYANGKYTFTVTCADNTEYFKVGQININPAMDVFNGDLYDPLTPFKLDFDASTGFVRGEMPDLLDENVAILNSKCIKGINGRFRGQALTADNYSIQDPEQIASKLFRVKLNDPLGFVYRWKEGIGSLTLSGEPHTPGVFRGGKVGSPPITTDPFAGQDFMNVLSLLITGKPYDYNTFLKAALAKGNLSRDDFNNASGASSFFRTLISSLTKTNQSWGNFIPFKKLVVNDAAYSFLRSGQFDLTVANQAATSLLQQRAQKFDELTTLVPQLANNPQFYKSSITGTPASGARQDIDALSKLGGDIIQLDAQIKQQQDDFIQHIQQTNVQGTDGTLRIFGNDISFDPTVTTNNTLTLAQTNSSKNDLREQLNYLTQRRLWKVKSNTDDNLFIVDDSYDKNYDLQAFEAAIRKDKFQTYRSDYKSIFETIASLKRTFLGMEVFADSQGHIQARPPQYNRMPSSVFYRMIQQKTTSGIQVFPDFLESLFTNQIEGVGDQIEVVEDEIRIRCAALGATDDSTAASLLNGTLLPAGGGVKQFTFVTDTDGNLGGRDFRALLYEATPDLQEASIQAALDELNALQSNIQGAVASTVNFDVVQQINVVNTATIFQGVNSSIITRINEIGQRLQFKTGNPAPTLATLLSNNRSTTPGPGRSAPRVRISQSDLVKLAGEIANFLNERQNLIKLLANAIENLDQVITFELKTSTGSNESSIFPTLNLQSSVMVPDIMQHMLEDETYDDFGTDAGKRYVIRDHQVVTLTVGEAIPPWTILQVDGEIDNNLVQGPQGFAVGTGGNGMSTAWAADYDMWRMYGFRSAHSVRVPFFSDPETQCAPYAVFLLNLARKDILHANCTVIGNEYIQAGEVYYLEDRDLLFYATSVSHSFTYGGEFHTTLDLKYGRTPGEYLPTVLDIVGKGLYTKSNKTNLIRHVRHNLASGDIPLATLVADNRLFGSSVSSLSDLMTGTFGTQNSRALGNLIIALSGILTPTNSQQLNVEIRSYYNPSQGAGSANSTLVSIANTIATWLTNPQQSGISIGGSANNLIPDLNGQAPLNPKYVKQVSVDLSKDDEVRTPSSLAWNLARSLANSASIVTLPIEGSNLPNINQQLSSLFNSIIDIWITFTPGDAGVTTNPPNPTSQASQAEQASYTKNFNSFLNIKGTG